MKVTECLFFVEVHLAHILIRPGRYQVSDILAFTDGLPDGAGRYFQAPAYTTLGFRNNQDILVNESTAEYIGANHYNIGAEFVTV